MKSFETKTISNLTCVHIVARKVTAKVPQHVYIKQRALPTDTHAASVIVVITLNMYVGARTYQKAMKMTLTMDVSLLIPSVLLTTHYQTSIVL